MKRATALFLLAFAACGGDGGDVAGGEVLPPGTVDAGPDAGATDGSIAESDDAGEGAEAGPLPCAPPTRMTFTSASDVPLGCDANAPATILDEALPIAPGAKSRVLGRARFRVRHVASNVTHFWNVRVVVGDGATSFGLGDDVCPGTSHERSNLGLGTASAAAPRAKLVGHEGASPCTPGALVVDKGATLDVWIEDGRPACAGKDIVYASHYLANGFSTTYAWKTSMEAMPGVTAKLATTGASEKLRVLGVVEGSPAQDPNTVCGAEAATLVMQTALDGAIVTTAQDVVPASQGMGHLVLSSTPGVNDAGEVRSVAPGAHEAKLLVGSNFVGTVTTGGCCGDGAIAIVRER